MAMIEVVIGFARLYADFGISSAIVYRQDSTQAELSSLYWLNYISGGVVFTLIILIRPLVIMFYQEPRLGSLLGWISLVFLIAPIGQQFQILLQKELHFKQIAIIEIVSSIGSTIVAIVSAIAGMGVAALILGEIARVALRSIHSFIEGRKIWSPNIHFNFQEVRSYMSFGLFQMGEKSLNFLNQRIDQIMIGAFMNAQALGYYTLAYNLAITPFLRINPILTRVAFPIFARLQGDATRLKDSYLKLINSLAFINFPVLVGMGALANLLVQVLFGDEWIYSVLLLQILVIVALIRSILNPIGNLMLAKGRADMGFYWNLIMLFIHPPFLYLCIQHWGLHGAAWALVFLFSMHFIFGYQFLLKPLVGDSLKEYLMSFSRALVTSLLMGVVVFSVNQWGGGTGLLWLIMLVLSGALIYFLLNWWLYREQLLWSIRMFFGGREKTL